MGRKLVKNMCVDVLMYQKICEILNVSYLI